MNASEYYNNIPHKATAMAVNVFESLFTGLFVLFNMGYAIISAFFVKPWGANVLFKTAHWDENLEFSIPFEYYYEGAAGLCLGISIMALIMYNETIPATVRSRYYLAQIFNWIMWTAFEGYYLAMGYTRTVIAIFQIFLCLVAFLLAFFAYHSLKDEIQRATFSIH